MVNVVNVDNLVNSLVILFHHAEIRANAMMRLHVRNHRRGRLRPVRQNHPRSRGWRDRHGRSPKHAAVGGTGSSGSATPTRTFRRPATARAIFFLGVLLVSSGFAATDYASVADRRVEAASLTEEEKAAWFEQHVLAEFSSPDCRLVAKLRTDGPDIRDIQTTAHFLAAISMKYGVLPTPETAQLALEIIEDIIAADALDGLDGRLSAYCDITDGLPKPGGTLTANGHTQLFFGYVTAWRMIHDPRIRETIQSHVTLIAQRYIDDGFILKAPSGHALPYSDVRATRWQASRSRRLDSLVFQETALLFVDDETIREHILQLQKKAVRAGYLGSIKRLHVSFLNVKLPSHATDWLNVLRLFTLAQASGSPEYRIALSKLYRTQRKEMNPLFNSMSAIISGSASAATNILLDTFPLTLNNRPVYNRDVPRRIVPRLVKSEWFVEARDPLPIYRRQLRAHNWKANPYAITAEPVSESTFRYSGVDYLLAYWMHRYAQIERIQEQQPAALVVDDRKLERDAITRSLETQGYTVVQTATVEEAKAILLKRPITQLVTDLDLSRNGTGLRGRKAGLELLQWVREGLDNGDARLATLREVTLHSTLFNSDDPWGRLLPRSRRRICRTAEDMGFTVQPKTVLTRVTPGAE